MKTYISFLVSIFVAFVLWMVVNLNGEYEENFKARVVIKNLNPEKAISSDYPDIVNLRVRGQGWKILPFYFFAQPQIFIDMSNAGKTLNVNLLADHRVKFSLPENVRIVMVEPEILKIELEEKGERRVPVAFKYEIKKDAYGFVYPPRLSPDSVVISGARSIVSKIDSISTEKISIERAGEYRIKLSLENPNKKLIKLNHDFVEANFRVEQIVEREFTVPVQVIGLPSDKEVIFFPPDVRVVVRGALSKLVEISGEYFTAGKDTSIKALINYRDVLNDKTGLVKPQIVISEGLELVSVSPEGLEYIIRQK